MKNIPNSHIFKEPEGYFDTLPKKVIDRRKTQIRQVYIFRAAIAAILLVGLSFMFLLQQPWVNEADYQVYDPDIEDEVELYISSEIWQAEDVLLLSDDPNEILDKMIEIEYVAYMSEPDPMDDDFWF
ncbi:hypothetical protein [Anditalea andensis]|uniref:Uncharacterized protein n=1 Tax=Anditalea andensis TaxID=1048983 RepID=A0A074L223_9BACT|nr:hypothetical protein [Anditalea andensis]KEO74530.1 hypothetical protein EL17_02320 [Anditalea andensis]